MLVYLDQETPSSHLDKTPQLTYEDLPLISN